MTKWDTAKLQRDLNNCGFGPLAVDGIYGQSTRDAYARMLRLSDANGAGNPVPVPVAVKPWWLSRSVVGSVSGILVSLLGLAGWSLDTEQLTSLLLAIAGLVSAGISLYGSITRTAPIDRSLVAPGYRAGFGMCRDPVPPDVAPTERTEDGFPAGPFFDDSRR